MKKYWKISLLVILISNCWWLYGSGRQTNFTPLPIRYFAEHKGGDWDFWGNGPLVTAKVSISVIEQKAIEVYLYLDASETKGNSTQFQSEQTRLLWSAPEGYIITGIVSPQGTISQTQYIDSNHDPDYCTPSGGPVSQFIIMGDQMGNDHPYMDVYFKEFKVQLKESSSVPPPTWCDVPANPIGTQFSGIPNIKNSLGFNIPPGFNLPNETKHFQGIARGTDQYGFPLFYLTKSADVAGELWVVRMGSRPRNGELLGSNTGQGVPPITDCLISRILFDGKSTDFNGNIWGKWCHPGGIQLTQGVLAVSAMGKNESGNDKCCIMLIDFLGAEQPVLLKTIDDFGDINIFNTNAVGVTQIPYGEHKGKYLFVVGGSRSPLLKFGISSGNDLRDPNLTINYYCDYTIPGGEKMIGESINLVRDTNGEIYLISFLGEAAIENWHIPNYDKSLAFLFKVDLYSKNKTVIPVKSVELSKSCNTYGDADAGGGVYVSCSGNLILYMSSHKDYDGYVKVGEFSSK